MIGTLHVSAAVAPLPSISMGRLYASERIAIKFAITFIQICGTGRVGPYYRFARAIYSCCLYCIPKERGQIATLALRQLLRLRVFTR